MKKVIAVVLVLVLGAGLAGCTGGTAADPEMSPSAAASASPQVKAAETPKAARPSASQSAKETAAPEKTESEVSGTRVRAGAQDTQVQTSAEESAGTREPAETKQPAVTAAPKPTPVPTVAPTAVPTAVPTPEPTPEPVFTPTEAPEQIPDDDPQGEVWIPTNGGQKYHSHSGCSNMIDPRYVTISEAEALGFTSCKRCYG